MRYLALAVVCGALAACSTVQTEKVYLRNAASVTVTCGPYFSANLAAGAAAQRESQCISDYQRQGYERVPGPAR